MKKLFISTSIFLFSTLILRAENLDTYRKFFKTTAQSSDRIKMLQDLNGKFKEIDLRDDAKRPIPYPSEKGKPMRKFSSSYFRSALDRAGEALKEYELHGKPRVFDPSMTPNDLSDARWEKRREIFKAEILDRKVGAESIYDHILNQLYADFQTQKLKPTSATATAEPSAYEAVIASSLREFIRNHQPKPEDLRQPKDFKLIESVLGSLNGVEIFDSFVTRLNFVTTKNNQSVSHPLNLGMLINIRSGADEYFVIMLGLLTQQIESEIDASYKVNDKDGGFATDRDGQRIRKSLSKEQTARLEKLEVIDSFISTKFDEAVESNQLLLSLDPVQLSFLIDLMLQLRKQDIPAEGEFAEISSVLSTEMMKLDAENDALEAAAQKANRDFIKITRLEKFNLEFSQVENDLGFYGDLNRQLYKLQYQLEFEKGEK